MYHNQNGISDETQFNDWKSGRETLEDSALKTRLLAFNGLKKRIANRDQSTWSKDFVDDPESSGADSSLNFYQFSQPHLEGDPEQHAHPRGDRVFAQLYTLDSLMVRWYHEMKVHNADLTELFNSTEVEALRHEIQWDRLGEDLFPSIVANFKKFENPKEFKIGGTL